ncbi:strawberry notch-like NTP hydrolase domain-containing protein [Rubrimonas cliftonensis]|uniref:Methyltransferase small domain-containing protein n=1 Tax=Rubrimonas cliftonensis TaxID=89524 RepID=A0A1H4EQS9_9RHOB|nr:strawberry notch family protein [Rubrimonas cliftonensis]SEA87219.1 Methyltransferase small domain-containing protein [Rubrimonas cliftonensis]
MNLLTPIADAAPSAAGPALAQLARALFLRALSGPALTPALLSRLMTDAFDGGDASGRWSWRQAYDVGEAAAAKAFIRNAEAMKRRDAETLTALAAKTAARLPLQSRRSETQNRLSQFSTPLPLAVVAAIAAHVRAGEPALEPSCGTGLLAAPLAALGARLVLNEIDADRRALAEAATGVAPTAHDAEFIDDLLDPDIRPSLVVMNPPFSATVARAGDPTVAGSHLVSALKRLADGGRLAAIMPSGFSAEGSGRAGWIAATERACLRARIALPGAAFARHGVRVDTVLAVFDKIAQSDVAPLIAQAATLDEALAMAATLTRGPSEAARPSPTDAHIVAPPAAKRSERVAEPSSANAEREPELLFAIRREAGAPLVYTVRDEATASGEDGLYAAWRLGRVAIPDAREHPTPLVESAAMASIAPPAPTAQPVIPASLVRRGALSDAQLETLIYAAEAFERDLPGAVRIDAEWRSAVACPDDAPDAVKLRRGFFLGDGTGCGKGRQVAGVILDAWNRGLRRAVWLSKSDKLIEDAIRDWTALGGDAGDVRPLAKWKLGEDVRRREGILFVTYATLRVGPRQGKAGRLEQIAAWLGAGFEGVIAFDEAHAMGGAAGSKSDRGDRKGSQQGVAGLRLQLAAPRARVLYVSATGATTIENLAYASRLGLWGQGDYPFQTREAFMTAMEAGGVAAMEVVARDLKALGLYTARALSFDGVEYEILEHALTPAQTAVYDAFADSFQVIHRNLEAAMKATGITGHDGACNDKAAKAAVRSRFESLKQRFFNHLLTGMKTPAMLDDVEETLAAGMSAVIQIVSTGEALMDRRLDALTAEEREDLVISATPLEYVVEYLREAFPTELRRVCEDENGAPYTELVRDETGRVVESREAAALRDAMIENLCMLTPVQTALDQILWRFGPRAVAEATGRTRRVVEVEDGGERRLRVERRAGAANTAETQAFMRGDKRILVFSEAGGTGRSYHADRDAPNRERRVHYLLEAGWKADTAVQGLGRTHRSNQVSAPLFKPVTTDVKGEKRFISTISRRLDSLGALTKGAARTGGQGMFRTEDNLESRFAKAALRVFYAAVSSGEASSIALEAFEAKTGLKLVGEDGALLEELPPITRFLNRILALRIAEQNAIFEEFTDIIAERVAEAEAAGQLEDGCATLVADSVELLETHILRTCAVSGAETIGWRLRLSTRIERFSVADMRRRYGEALATMVNDDSGAVAFQRGWNARYHDDGMVEEQVQLLRPHGREVMTLAKLGKSCWRACDEDRFAALWQAAVAALPEFEREEVILIGGLILPVWKHLGEEAPTIRRVTTDCGRTLIGRVVAPDRLKGLTAVMRAAAPTDAQGVAHAVMIGGRKIALAQDARLARRLVAGSQRCEIENAPADLARALKAAGCFVEIIQYRARVFAPVTADLEPAGVEALARVLALLPPVEA